MSIISPGMFPSFSTTVSALNAGLLDQRVKPPWVLSAKSSGAVSRIRFFSPSSGLSAAYIVLIKAPKHQPSMLLRGLQRLDLEYTPSA